MFNLIRKIVVNTVKFVVTGITMVAVGLFYWFAFLGGALLMAFGAPLRIGRRLFGHAVLERTDYDAITEMVIFCVASMFVTPVFVVVFTIAFWAVVFEWIYDASNRHAAKQSKVATEAADESTVDSSETSMSDSVDTTREAVVAATGTVSDVKASTEELVKDAEAYLASEASAATDIKAVKNTPNKVSEDPNKPLDFSSTGSALA